MPIRPAAVERFSPIRFYRTGAAIKSSRAQDVPAPRRYAKNALHYVHFRIMRSAGVCSGKTASESSLRLFSRCA